MPSAPEHDGKALLLEALEKDNGVGAFYLCGEDEAAKAALCRKVKDAQLSSGTNGGNYLEVDARGLRGDKLDNLLHSPPLLASRRVLVIHCADKLEMFPRFVLERYFRHRLEEELLLVLVNTPHTKRDENLAEDENLTLVECS